MESTLADGRGELQIVFQNLIRAVQYPLLPCAHPRAHLLCHMQAARYQMVIMFMITASASLGTVAAVLGAVLTAVDLQHRLRSERLLPRATPHKGVAHWVQAQVLKVRLACRSLCVLCGLAGPSTTRLSPLPSSRFMVQSPS